jgi:hypothetical protein
MKIRFQNLILALFILIGLTLAPLCFASAGYTLSGMNPGSYNGQYCLNGSTTSNGQPTYTNGTDFLYESTDTATWYAVFGGTIDPNYSTSHWGYYGVPGGSLGAGANDPGPQSLSESSWQPVSGTTFGIITSSTCGGGGSGTSTPLDILPNLIGQVAFTASGTYSSTTFDVDYQINTTTNALIQQFTDHTQEDMFYGIVLMLATFYFFTKMTKK